MEQVFLESKSKYSFDVTVSGLSEFIPDGGWKIIHQHE